MGVGFRFSFLLAEVIGDVQEFTFSTPMPFFLNDDYDMNLISTDDIGTILGQGALLAVAGMIQGPFDDGGGVRFPENSDPHSGRGSLLRHCPTLYLDSLVGWVATP